MIKNVIFDMGGVLIRWDPRAITDELLPDEPETLREEAFSAFFGLPEWPLQDSGELTSAEFAAMALSRAPERLRGALERLISGWKGCLPPLDGMRELIGELRSRGLGIYILSNASDNFYDIPSVPAFTALADGHIASWFVRCAKPDERIFRLLLDKYSLSAGECLFTDDLEANVRGARAAGLQAVRFESPSALRAELCGLGLL